VTLKVTLPRMKKLWFLSMLIGMTMLAALWMTASVAGQGPTHGSGGLILWGDLAVFATGQPEACFLRNRFRKGEPVGFRMTAIDGGTNEPEPSAELIVHLTYGGKTLDIPARYRGTGRGEVRPNQWTAKWIVPDDAPTGTVQYTVTAKDRFGRVCEWKPFGFGASGLTIIGANDLR
jgi:hypothetical protein